MPNWTPSQLNAISLHGRTVLVSAAAGSGKTTTLTERIIRSLIGDGKGPGADLSRILVVTFTKSAAADLRAKISEALSREISENPSRKHLVRQLLDLGSAQICTIDSFYLSHLRNHFSEAGLPPQFRMAEQAETESLAKETMEDLINEFYGKYGTIPGDAGLSALDGNPFEEALDQISPSKDRGDLVELLLATYTRLTAVPDGLSVFREAGHRLGEEAKEDFLATAPGAMFKEELTALLDSVVSFYEEALKKLGTDPALSNYAVSFGSERDCAVLFRDTLTNGTYEKFYKAVWAHQFEDLKRISTKCQTAIDLESLKKGRKKYLAMLKGIGDGWLVSAPEEIAAQMEKTSKVSSIIADFLIAFDERFSEEKRSRGICDFSDPRRKLLALLTDPDGSPSPLAVEIASKYDEIYIDEYQDVDAVQDRIFTLISRSNRFMVGDIKQSIYGFRGAEPSVFADYRRRLPLYPDDLNGSSEGSTVFMSENFRCDEPVIDFTNLVCSFAFRVCPGMEYKKEDDLIFAKGNKNGRLPDKVHIALVNRPAPSQSKEADSPDEDDEPRGEPAWVAQKICELLKTCKKEDGETLKPSDVAILMRSSTQFRKFSDALRQAGIPVQSPKSDSPGDDPEMILLMRTLELIDNPQNDIALESVLSSLFGFTLEQLIAIRHAAGSAYSLSGALHRASEEEGPLAESCKTFLAWLDRWQKDSIAMPADLFIRLLWRDERLADIASGDAAATIYDYARSYQAVAYNGLYGFLNYFKRLLEDEKNLRLTTSAAENATGVSIRTIHDAKGLEFPVVFICCTHQGFNTDDLKKDLICHEQLGLTMKLFSPDDLVRHDNLIRLSASIPVSYKLIEEEIRIMYVALTRAREHLYVTATVTKDGASILDDAAWIRPGCRYDILHAKNMLTWIMAAKNADPATFAKCADLSVIDPAMIKKAAYLPDPGEETAESGPASDETDARYRSVLEKAGTYSYPYAYLEGIPPFVNASAASNDWLEKVKENAAQKDEEEMQNIRSRMMHNAYEMLNHFTLTDQKPDAAKIGSAMHLFLQYCDWQLIGETGAVAELERLREKGFIPDETAALISADELRKLENSELMDLMRGAKDIIREFRFHRPLEITSLTRSPELKEQFRGETVMLNGAIDLLLRDRTGRLVLVDYKTDRIRPETGESEESYADRMQVSHGKQLSLYAEAVEEIFAQHVDLCYIYSLPLQKLIRIDPAFAGRF